MTFPFRFDTSDLTAPPLPKAADVVVIGGGIIGVSAALDLADRGVSVTLLEKGRIAGEQSSRNWGWIRVQGRDLSEVPIALDAQRQWQDLDARTGHKLGLSQTGTLYLAHDASGLDRFSRWIEDAQTFQVSSHLLSAEKLCAHIPAAARRWAGALYTPTDFRAEPWRAVPMLAQLAQDAGASVIEGCAVRALDLEGGKITGVLTERGRIATSSVILAGGAWSSLMLRRHDIDIPQLSVRATVAATEPLPDVHDGGAVDDHLAWRRRDDGGYTLAPSGFHELYVGPDAFRALRRFAPQLWQDPLGTKLFPAAPRGFPDAWSTPRKWDADRRSPFEAMRILNPSPNMAKVSQIARQFGQTFPGAGPVRIKQAWAGMTDTMPDVVPVVDRAPSLPGLTICTGMCGHGFGIGPAFGRIAAALATHRDFGHDLDRFRISRFSDGTKLQLGPNL